MLGHPIIEYAPSLIENGDSKVLGLTFGSTKLKPGDQIHKGGEALSTRNPLLHIQLGFAPSLLTGARRPLLEAQALPRLTFTAPSGNYLIVSVDLDVTISLACSFKYRLALGTGRI
jgi:hypothetical protein